MRLYPVMINIESRTAVVVGGGAVAMRKVLDLLDAGAKIKIIAPEIHEKLESLIKENESSVNFIKRKYRDGDLEGASLVFTATDDSAVNRAVFQEAEKKGIFINSADDPPNCSFFVPSFMRRGDLILALSTGGTSPAMAARLRREIEKNIPENIEEILSALDKARTILKNEDAFCSMDASRRGSLLKKIVNEDRLLHEIVEAYKKNKIIQFLQDNCRSS